jgi:hypothetical protein
LLYAFGLLRFWRFAKRLDVKSILFSHDDDWPHLCFALYEVEEEFIGRSEKAARQRSDELEL